MLQRRHNIGLLWRNKKAINILSSEPLYFLFAFDIFIVAVGNTPDGSSFSPITVERYLSSQPYGSTPDLLLKPRLGNRYINTVEIQWLEH